MLGAQCMEMDRLTGFLGENKGILSEDQVFVYQKE